MKRVLLAVSAVLLVTGSLIGIRRYAFAAHAKGSQAQKIPPMTIRILSPTKPFTVAQNQTFTVVFEMTGMMLDAQHIGGASIPHRGHFHIYIDCIPDGAYSKALLVIPACWYGTTSPQGGPLYPITQPNTVAYAKVRQPINFKTLGMVPAPLRPTRLPVLRGHHLLILALARNDHVLWKVPAAVLPFTIK